jgi:hypothetical protein
MAALLWLFHAFEVPALKPPPLRWDLKRWKSGEGCYYPLHYIVVVPIKD